jgi:hypothetical protein
VTFIRDWEETYQAIQVQKAIEALAENVTGTVVPLPGHWIPEEQLEFVIEQLTGFFNEWPLV